MPNFKEKNSKVFEQKGDLLNFESNIDPMAMLSQVKPGWAEFNLSLAELSWVELSRSEASWADSTEFFGSSIKYVAQIFFVIQRISKLNAIFPCFPNANIANIESSF